MVYDEGRLASDAPSRQASRPSTDWGRPSDERVLPTAEATAVDAEPAAAKTRHPAARAAREIVETLLLALIIFLAVRMVVLNFRVDGHSMDPNLDDAQMLLVNRNAYLSFDGNRLRNLLPGDDREGADEVYPFDPPERGDIVVFDPPVTDGEGKPYIKRVIGLPGERITFRKGDVLVDGQLLEEPYISGHITECDQEPENCRLTVPEGSVFVLGDNRDNSTDSRSFGTVDVDAIVGKAWFSYWPFDDLGLVPHYDYPGIAER